MAKYSFGSGGMMVNGVPIYGALGIGHVYQVSQSTQSYWGTFNKDRKASYKDGTQSLHGTIQAALNACTADRNDYVIVYPDSDDYDLTTYLTLTKKSVHMIGAGGIQGDAWAGNHCRIHQTGNYIVASITGQGVEFAGFFIKGDHDYDVIEVGGASAQTYGVWIHHNFIGMASNTSTKACGIDTGAAGCSYCLFEKNHITLYSPGTDNSCEAFIRIQSSSSTENRIQDNTCVSRQGTFDGGIQDSGAYATFILRNTLMECVAHGGTGAGTLTLGISSGTNSIVADNRIMIQTKANAVNGASANDSYIENYNGSGGGLVST